MTEQQKARDAYLERALAVIGALALCVVFFGLVALSIEATHERQQIQHPAEREHSASFSLSVRGESGSYQVSGEARRENEERWLWFSSPEDALAWLTALLVIGTGFLAYYTAGLWRATLEALKDAKRNSLRQSREFRQSLKIANDTAKSASRSAKAALAQAQALIEIERPKFTVRAVFLYGKNADGVLGPKLMPPEILPSRIAFGATWENTGRTSAEALDVRIGWLLLDPGEKLPEMPTYSTRLPFYPGYHVAAGKMTVEFWSNSDNVFEFSESDRSAIKAGTKTLVFFAEMNFLDQMNMPQATRVCGEWLATIDGGAGFRVPSNCPEAYLRKPKH